MNKEENRHCDRCFVEVDWHGLYRKNDHRDYSLYDYGICINCIPKSYKPCCECDNITRKHCVGSEDCKLPLCGECRENNEHSHLEDMWTS